MNDLTKIERIKWGGTCAGCGKFVSKGSTAYWNSVAKQLYCPSCADSAALAGRVISRPEWRCEFCRETVPGEVAAVHFGRIGSEECDWYSMCPDCARVIWCVRKARQHGIV